MQSIHFKPTRVLAAALSAALVVSLAAIEFSGSTATAVTPTYTYATTTLPATDDTLVAQEAPTWAAGSLDRLVAQNDTLHKQAYLKFTLPQSLLGATGQIDSVVLGLTAYDTSRSVVSWKP